MRKILILVLLFFTSMCFGLIDTPDFLPSKQAFQVNAKMKDAQNAIIEFKVLQGYQLYKNKIHIFADSPGVTLGDIAFPESILIDDAEGSHQVFDKNFQVIVPIKLNSQPTIPLVVKYQGCKRGHYCYRPDIRVFTLKAQPNPTPTNTTTLTQQLNQKHPVLLFFIFIALGVALTFTPCVLPMIPIILAMMMGENAPHSWHRRLLISICYVLGICLVYSVIGLLIGLGGQSIQASMQAPSIIIVTALFFAFFALALLDIYHIHLPQRWHNFLSHHANSVEAGTLFGSMLIGALSALIVSPCLSAPLAAVVSYIGLNGNAMVGAISLFGLGLGVGIPLILVATFGISILPKSGPWLTHFKHFLGILMLAVSLFLLSRVVTFPQTSIHSEKQLQPLLIQAKKQHQPVILDFYADWCIECTLIHRHFVTLEEESLNYQLIRVDISEDNDDNKQLQQKYRVFAPPTIVFINANGEVLENKTIFGYVEKQTLLQAIKSL